MRPILFGVCVFAAACSGQSLNSPTSPTSATAATFAPVQTQATNATQLPLRGEIAGTSSAVVTPPNIQINQTGEGTATQLGRFTAKATNFAVLGAPAATGTWEFTAANGDQLFATTTSTVEPIAPPLVGQVTTIATIVGGTGRFSEATGTFTVRFIDIHNEVSATGTFSGSFEGRLNLNK